MPMENRAHRRKNKVYGASLPQTVPSADPASAGPRSVTHLGRHGGGRAGGGGVVAGPTRAEKGQTLQSSGDTHH